MKYHKTSVAGVVVLELEPFRDERGFFARSFDESEFAERGLVLSVRQANLSYNGHSGTIRGMHFQSMPSEESKIVTCTQGAIYDVALDLRPDSPSYMEWTSLELRDTSKMIYVPPGCAHGFQTLTDGAEISYLMGDVHRPERDRGARWNDPAFGIRWPLPCSHISDRDAGFPDFVVR